MTRKIETLAEYEAWLKGIPDNSLSNLWADKCAPSEAPWKNTKEQNRAWLVHCEMQNRALLHCGGFES